MGKDVADTRGLELDLDPPLQQAVCDTMEELGVSALEALWFVEGETLGEDS